MFLQFFVGGKQIWQWQLVSFESLVILSWWANFDGSFWCVVSWFSRHVPACPCVGQRPQTFRECGQSVLWQESFLWSSLLDPGMALADAYEAGNWHCWGYPWQRDSTWFPKVSGAIFPCRVVICFDATLPDSRFPHTWQLTLKTTSIQASRSGYWLWCTYQHLSNLSWNHYVWMCPPIRLDSEWWWVYRECIISRIRPDSSDDIVGGWGDVEVRPDITSLLYLVLDNKPKGREHQCWFWYAEKSALGFGRLWDTFLNGT